MKRLKKIYTATMGLALPIAMTLASCAPAKFKIAGPKPAPTTTTSAILSNPVSNDAQGAGVPQVTVKVNGSDLDLQVAFDTEISVDWASRGTSDCIMSQDELAVATGASGTYKTKAPATPGVIRFSTLCESPTGPITDEIFVTVGVPNVGTGVPGASSETLGSPATPFENDKISTESTSPGSTLSSLKADLKANGEAANIEIPYLSTVLATWSSEGATECIFEPGAQPGLSGTVNLEKLTSNTTVTLTCKNMKETLVISRSISVTPPLAPSIDLKINGSDGPVIAPPGSPLKISWTSLQATQCTLTTSGQTLSLGLQGDMERPAGDLLSQHTLRCEGPGGSSSDTVVTAPALVLPKVTITAQGIPNMVEVAPGVPIKIDWSSSDATQCAVKPGPFSGTSGSQTVSPLTQKTDFVALCEGPFGLASATVVVIPKTASMDLALMINGSTIGALVLKNTPVNISWTSTNAKSCLVQPFAFTGLSGKDRPSPPISQAVKVQLTCLDVNNLSKTVEVPISVSEDGNNLPKIDVKVNGSDGPLYVEANAPMQIVWTTKNLTLCKLNQTVDVEPNGTKNLSVSTDSKVTLTCKTPTQTLSDEVEVLVRPKGVAACKVGVQIKDGGSWHKADGTFHGVAVCAPTGHFKIYGQEIVSEVDQKVSLKVSKSSSCNHSVTLVTKNPGGTPAIIPSSQKDAVTLSLKKNQVIEVQLTNSQGCPDQSTRSSLDRVWSRVTPNQCPLY